MILHVACLPFPTYQGTQASIAAMLEASSGAGRPAQLLTYAQGAYELDAAYALHRIPDRPKLRSFRSGPSWGKVALDARCIFETRRVARRLQVEVIIAHHVEAALAALASRAAPVYYVAHTSLARELPEYFPSLSRRLVGGAGARLERVLCSRAAGVAAVAPSLAELLGNEVTYLPVPWKPSTSHRPSQEKARAALGLASDAEICVYAGNLDPYQGWETLIEALAVLRRSHPRARLLLATESNIAPAELEAQRFGISDSVDFRRIDGESARALAHSAADFTWIPRRTEGGLPIKMLDAFARRLPVVAMERATASLPIRDACIAVHDDDAGALAEGARKLLENDGLGIALSDAASAYLDAQHSATAFEDAMQRLLSGSRTFVH